MKLMNILNEKKVDSYEYGCAMLYFNFPEIGKLHNAIKKKDLYEEENDRSYGIEDEPHTTLLFGFHDDANVKDISDIINNFTFSKCIIKNASLFENPQYDVLKFDVEGKNLHECNAALKEFPHTNNFPNYHPHMTIAYIKSGLGKKYVSLFKDLEFQLVPDFAVYSSPDGSKKKIKIKVEKNEG